MANEIIIPDFGTSIEEVRLIRWLKSEGDTVKKGDALCELETDKATTELESVAQGVLLKQVAGEDTDVFVGDVIAYVGEPGESLPE